MAKLFISDEAEADLKRIAEHTKEEWGETQKDVVMSQIRKTLETISVFPKLLMPTSKIGYFTKSVPKLPFVVVCRLEADSVTIMQILHDKQNR
jgi:plasmid stabilization system protein ParE